MKSNLIFLLLIVLITSCTIQKRVHNRGWHIQWNSNRSVSNQDSKEEKSTIELTEMNEDERNEFSPNPVSVEPSFSQSTVEGSSDKELDVTYELDEAKNYETSMNEHSSVHPTDSVVYKIKNGHTNRSSADRRSGDFAVPILYFILAGFATLITIYFVMIAQTATDLTGLIALFGVAVFGGVAIVLIMLAIISLIVILTVHNNK